MTIGLDELQKDATVVATDDQLATISALATQQLGHENVIADYEDRLKQEKEKLKKVQEVLLPEAMAAAGISEFRTTSGAKIAIKEDLSVSVPKSRMAEIADWLREHGLGDILKETMVVALDDPGDAAALRTFITDSGMTADEKLDVNTATLKATLREQIAQGENIDLKFFGGYAWKRAVITPPPAT